MSIAKTYDPKIAEDKWYKHWQEKGYFSSSPDEREPFTIVIPPPNVTGVLHMGPMLNNTIIFGGGGDALSSLPHIV